jgi:hypothetical protein
MFRIYERVGKKVSESVLLALLWLLFIGYKRRPEDEFVRECVAC